MSAACIGDSIAQRKFVLTLPDGEDVIAEEQFFVVPVTEQTINRDRWTSQEAEVIQTYRWWSATELKSTSDIVWPNNLPQMLMSSGWWPHI